MKTVIEALCSELEFTRSCEKSSNDQIKYLEEELERVTRERDHHKANVKIGQGIIERQAEDYSKLKNDTLKKAAPLTEEQMSFILDPSRYLTRKIDMIKCVRSCTSMGLKEAKEFVEAHIHDFQNFADRIGFEIGHDNTEGKSVFVRVSDKEKAHNDAGR